MRVVKKSLCIILLWLLLAPHRAGQLVSGAGDLATGEIARLYFNTLNRLGQLEEGEAE